ncbi:hypothetical protein ANCDUO_18797 [Ancylostoma duodenale]|uniref:Uncharacterized protein n=1 Tax=Ancylostoma duodenale TaxID=51022 RepID=A0A0C2FWV7_9BILA|nr:hypothetical protein ANCDUO_18797 [Ancylostoma duodenale]
MSEEDVSSRHPQDTSATQEPTGNMEECADVVEALVKGDGRSDHTEANQPPSTSTQDSSSSATKSETANSAEAKPPSTAAPEVAPSSPPSPPKPNSSTTTTKTDRSPPGSSAPTPVPPLRTKKKKDWQPLEPPIADAIEAHHLQYFRGQTIPEGTTVFSAKEASNKPRECCLKNILIEAVSG